MRPAPTIRRGSTGSAIVTELSSALLSFALALTAGVLVHVLVHRTAGMLVHRAGVQGGGSFTASPTGTSNRFFGTFWIMRIRTSPQTVETGGKPYDTRNS